MSDGQVVVIGVPITRGKTWEEQKSLIPTFQVKVGGLDFTYEAESDEASDTSEEVFVRD